MSERIKRGDMVGFISKVLFDMKGNENYWRLTEGKVKSITINSRGRRIKADHFYTLDADEIESNTKWMEETEGLVLVTEPFLLTDKLKERANKWIEQENASNPECKLVR